MIRLIIRNLITCTYQRETLVSSTSYYNLALFLDLDNRIVDPKTPYFRPFAGGKQVHKLTKFIIIYLPQLQCQIDRDRGGDKLTAQSASADGQTCLRNCHNNLDNKLSDADY